MSPASAPTNVAAPPDACPRCQKPLVDPTGLGWCKSCGYCRSLAESETKASPTVDAKAAPGNQLTATSSAIAQAPTWIWVMFAGMIAVAALTAAIGYLLKLAPFERALLTTLQIAAGLGVMFVGQFIGLMKIAPDESTLSFKDAVFPFRLYGLIFKRLPETSLTVYLGAWGIAAAVSAAIFIGGLGHWFNYLPGHPNNPAQATKSGR
ncbi:MAG: hypothetical protein HY289_10685 [Planctomycetes bacterium]|nr:hypothetical protein [Planctomycetota bacterium]